MNFQPHTIIELKIDEEEMIQRSKQDMEFASWNESPRLDHVDISLLRQSKCLENIAAIRPIYEKKYMNWHTIDGKLSKWNLKSIVKDISLLNLERRQNYLDKKTKGLLFFYFRTSSSNSKYWDQQRLYY